ncbi:hypothetical protein IJH29_00495 [Candidatus Saccharibacteria bacterium]|nr:hypothetical protein [Candidatus Saccharibacteria bacterium]
MEAINSLQAVAVVVLSFPVTLILAILAGCIIHLLEIARKRSRNVSKQKFSQMLFTVPETPE